MKFFIKKNKLSLSFFIKKLLYFLLATFSAIIFFIFMGILVIKLNFVDLFFNFVPKTDMSGVNVLVFGIDETRQSKRSDAILVMHLNSDQNHLGVLSIPRDTRVNIDTHGSTRINHAYAYGGVTLLRDSVSSFLNIPIDYYIQVDLSSVSKIINAIGGVSIDIKKDIQYTDRAGDVYIDLKQGQQLLNGDQAVQFLRFRQDEEGDIGRINRQQQFLSQLAKQVLSFKSVINLPEIVTIVHNAIISDLSFTKMVSLSLDIKHVFESGYVKKGTVPGAITLVGGAYYWKPNITALDKLIDNTLFGFSDDAHDANKQEVSLNSKLDEDSIQGIQSDNDLFENKHSQGSIISDSSNLITEDYVIESSNDMVFENIDPFINNPDEIESDVVTIELTPDLMEEDYGLTASQDSETSDVIEENIAQEKSMDLPLEIISESVIESDPSNEIILINHDTLTESKKDEIVIDAVNNVQNVDTGLVKVNQESKNTTSSGSDSIDRRVVSSDEVMRVIDQSDILESNFSNTNLRVEILNGVGFGGVAKIAASFLKSKGIIVPRFANAGSFDYDETVIVDWKGNLDKSVALAHLLQIDPERIIVYDRPQKPLDITLVLGKDWLNKDFDDFQVVNDKKIRKSS